MTITEYQILSVEGSDSAALLQAQVNQMIARGWQPLGGITIGSGTVLVGSGPVLYAQAMVQYGK